MSNVLNFNNINLAVEIGAAFGMLALTVGAFVYVSTSKTRVKSWVNSLIFVTLIIAFTFQAILSIYDLQVRQDKLTDRQRATSNTLYAGQFIF